MHVASSVCGSVAIIGARRTWRLIAIRTVIDRSQPPNAAGTLSCSIFCIALTSTSWHSSCASLWLPSRRSAIA